MSWIVACGLWMTSCAHAPEPFACTVLTAYDAHGQVDTAHYRVNTACLKGLSARVTACYREAQ